MEAKVEKFRFAAGDEAGWLALRERLGAEGRLGGSEVGVAAGLSPYKSRYRLWAEKKGLIARPDLSGRECVRLGRDLEDYVARRFCEASGRAVHRENCVWVNGEFPHLFASIDRKVANEASGLECKTASAWRAGDFTADCFPDSYYAQCCTYLAVTGFERWYLAVLVLGVGVRFYCLTTRAEDLEAREDWVSAYRLVDGGELQGCELCAARFVEMLGEDAPDSFDGSEDEVEAVREVAALAGDGGEAQEVDARVELWLEEREGVIAQVEELELCRAAIENEIRDWLGDSPLATGRGWKVSFKASKDSERVDWKAVAGELAPPEELVARHTQVRPGARVLRVSKVAGKGVAR